MAAVPTRQTFPAWANFLSSSHPELAFPSNSPPTDASLLTCFRMPFFLLLDLFLCCYHIWTILSLPSCLIPPKDGEHPQRKNQDPDGKKGRACEPSPEEPGLVWPGEEWLGVSPMSQAGDIGSSGCGRWAGLPRRAFSSVGPHTSWLKHRPLGGRGTDVETWGLQAVCP